MKITDLIKKDTIILNLKSKDKSQVIEELVEKLYIAGRLNSKEEYKRCIMLREEQSTTGIGEGIAIPHAKTNAVKVPAIAFGRTLSGANYNSLDGQPVNLFFMIAASEGAHNEHLETLSRLSTFLMDKKFRQDMLNASSEEEVLAIIDKKENELSIEKVEENIGESENNGEILAVTACPTGIAHTYMAADALKNKAKEMNVNIKVETNGSTGVKNALSEENIKEATAIIIAADKQVEMNRFDGKVVIEVPVAEAIKRPEELINKALNQEGKIFKLDGKVKEDKDTKKAGGAYKYLMNGVSNMLPFVVGGGILIALAFLFDFKYAGSPNYGSVTPVAKFCKDLGGLAFGFMLPVLAGFIASAIGDRPALAPGFVGGALASSGGAGFLGALVAGFLAGYIVLGLKKTFSGLPQSLEGIKPVLLFPLLGVLLIGTIMTFVVNPPVAAINTGINNWLSSLSGSNKVILGLILGLMMAIDMGGPINKAAYVFGVASIGEGNGHIMAAIMAGGMVPPLGIALATTFFKNKFIKSEIEAGKTNYVMGLSFITEGAIPFAAADPKRVIPATALGAALAGALSMFFGTSLPAPHGGIFVIPLATNKLMYLVAIIAGSVLTATLLNLLKKPVDSQ
ncbi:fructose-specific PTS transporter subunit EIIC [Clostridium sp. MB40-C1]|uniref:PTS fructose transporter subunit IIABC n=1 Tax=Clostridium sp. MB40-C1 TaxID=3070996 RepID=UPI0027DF5216|nr:PTS fructose transporter subunit IIABC [Clostridium sp. MB40-C1]WMJ79256.1 fructose-specific PTS transporter subunit EIIC [Clostridium sp. MB40-C1]